MDKEQEKATKILKGEQYHLEDKVGQLLEMGFNAFNLKLLVKSYTKSKCRMDGVVIDCGHFSIGIGPMSQKTWKVPKLKSEALEYLGINPHAARAFAREFIDSKLKKQGLHTLVDDVSVRIGPQNKNTFIVR